LSSCTRRRGDRKFERAALKYLGRYLAEANPSLANVAKVAALLAECQLLLAHSTQQTHQSPAGAWMCGFLDCPFAGLADPLGGRPGPI
jgi:hypothetical protein